MVYWVSMVLVVEKKFLESDWWRYGLALAIAKLILWVSLVYHAQAGLSLPLLWQSRLVLGTFLVAAFLPFAVGRLQLRILFWFSLTGLFLGEAMYLFLILSKIGQAANLLPFIAFVQLYVTCFGLGLVIELGRYAYRKVFE